MFDGAKNIFWFLGMIAGVITAYRFLVPDDTRKSHANRMSAALINLHNMRSLELAQQDAARLLRWLNWIYGTPGSMSLLSLDLWWWRCLLVCGVTVVLYVMVPQFVTDDTDKWSWTFLIIIVINTVLDMISVNVSRYLFWMMSRSTKTRRIGLLAVFDLMAGGLFYLSGPLWLFVWFRVEGPAADLSNLILFWREGTSSSTTVYVGIMFFSTIVPSAIHFLASVVFFGSKVLAQPLRLSLEKSLGYINTLSEPVGVVVALTVVAGLILLKIFAG